MPVIQLPYKRWRLWVTVSNITPLSLRTFSRGFFPEHQRRDCTNRKLSHHFGNSFLLYASFCPTHCICIPHTDACSVKFLILPCHITINSIFAVWCVWASVILCIGIARPVIKLSGIIIWSFFMFLHENSHCKKYEGYLIVNPPITVLVNGSEPYAEMCQSELPGWYCTWFSACPFFSLTEWWNFGAQVKALAQRMSVAAGKRLWRWREDGWIWSLFPWPMVLRCLGNLPTPLMVCLAN